LEVDEQIEKLAKKRKALLTSMKVHDDNRMQEAAGMREKMNERNEELAERIRQKEERLQKKKENEERIRKIKEAQEQQQRRELARRTCSECYSVFCNEHARDQHFHASHCFFCDYCQREFRTPHSMDQHKDATGHW
jgi:DNA repair exonuclease SbcCD ATPase subunit